jgi:hypothetical protein
MAEKLVTISISRQTHARLVRLQLSMQAIDNMRLSLNDIVRRVLDAYDEEVKMQVN